MPAACVCRNSRHVGPPRRGAGTKTFTAKQIADSAPFRRQLGELDVRQAGSEGVHVNRAHLGEHVGVAFAPHRLLVYPAG